MLLKEKSCATLTATHSYLVIAGTFISGDVGEMFRYWLSVDERFRYWLSV